MVKSKDRKVVEDVKVVPEEEVVQQPQMLLCDISEPIKDYIKIFVFKKKVWRLQETSIRNEFEAQFRENSFTIDKSGGVESMWKLLGTDLLESAVCGWTERPPRQLHDGGMTVAATAKEKRVAWKCWQNDGSKMNIYVLKKPPKSC